MRNVRGQLQRLTGGAHQPDLDRRTPPLTAIYAASITTWNGWAWIAGAALYLLSLPAGAASRALERRRATSRSLIVETIGLCHAGQGDFRQAIRAPRSAVGTLAQPDTPDHEQDADDLKRTQRLIQEQPS